MQPTACCPETGVVHSSLEIFSCKPVNKTYQYSTIRIFILLLLLLLSKYWPGQYLRLALGLPTFSLDTK